MLIQRYSLVFVLVLVFLGGCAPAMNRKAGLRSAPIELINKSTAPIAFNRLIIRVPSGTKLGSHHDGFLKIPKFSHEWNSNIVVGSDEFKIMASEELKNHGYNVKGGTDLLFGNDESVKAQFQLGGTMNSLEFNSYAPLAGGYNEAVCGIEWQVYNVYSKSIVYNFSSFGYGKSDGSGSGSIQKAFLVSLNNLMAEQPFVDLLSTSPREEWNTKTEGNPEIPVQICSNSGSLTLPEDLEKSFNSVVVIRAGASIGSGVIVTSDGYILTAAHVVSGLEEVIVELYSGLDLPAEIIAVDDPQDVALIKIPGSDHRCLEIFRGTDLHVGDDLFAVGAPSGEQLSFSVTKGIVSGFRDFEGFSYIQTDASLNPGNSGGPLLNDEGLVVGIVSWKIAAPGFEGLSFGVPMPALKTRLGLAWEIDKAFDQSSQTLQE